MARIDNFRGLEVWQLAMEVVVDCYDLTDKLPKDERYGLIGQARRSAVSVASNIAEGHNRHARKGYLNHVCIALASLAELDTQIEIAVRLKYLSATQAFEYQEKLERVGQMLRRLQQSLEFPRIGPMLALFGMLCAALLLLCSKLPSADPDRRPRPPTADPDRRTIYWRSHQ
jgi:four helix bundle protein